MGKRSREKKERRQHTSLAQHKRVGNTLVPPFQTVGFHLSRWSDVMLPELIWAGLLLTHGPRLNVIEMIRSLGDYLRRHEETLSRFPLTVSGISRMPDEHRSWLLGKVTAPAPARDILSALLLFDDLPGREHWEKLLPTPTSDGWTKLAKTVAESLYHQSQQATDCQWVLVFGMLMSGGIKVMSTLAEKAKEIALYPHYGDQHSVRPSVRSMAKGLEAGPNPPSPVWAGRFWATCMRQTPCAPLEQDVVARVTSAGTTAKRLADVRDALVQHAARCMATTAPDPQHDTTFGMALYALSLLEELMRIGNASTLLARSGLRTLLEANITLAYLIAKNDAELWRTYRVYKSGQAKLVSLKFRDGLAVAPEAVNAELAEMIANEDAWEEFVPIDLGHWEKSNLRSMAVEAGRKSEYDQFYGWTSMFTHGHWGAVRAAVFDVCRNPLHRLHRIPRPEPRNLGDVLGDCVALTDGLLMLVDRVYPSFTERLTVADTNINEIPGR